MVDLTAANTDFFNVLMSVEANSVEELVMKQIENNTSNGTTYKYVTVTQDIKTGKWQAWYMGNARRMVQEELNKRLKKKATPSKKKVTKKKTE